MVGCECEGERETERGGARRREVGYNISGALATERCLFGKGVSMMVVHVGRRGIKRRIIIDRNRSNRRDRKLRLRQ